MILFIVLTVLFFCAGTPGLESKSKRKKETTSTVFLNTASNEIEIQSSSDSEVLERQAIERARRAELRAARKARRKEKIKKFFSALADTCLDAVKVVACREAAYFINALPQYMEKLGLTTSQHRMTTVVDKNLVVGEVVVFANELMQSLHQQGKTVAFEQGSHFATLITLPSDQERQRYIVRLQGTTANEDFFEEMFFGIVDMLPKEDEQRVTGLYLGQYATPENNIS